MSLQGISQDCTAIRQRCARTPALTRCPRQALLGRNFTRYIWTRGVRAKMFHAYLLLMTVLAVLKDR